MGRGRIVTPLVAAAVAVAFLSTAALAFNVSTIAFDDGYVPLFGDGNVVPSADGKTVRLVLNQYSGSGFISSDLYDHGFFSATIKLPSDYTAGVVVAFYTSNGDVFEKTHDELDFEFLGNIRGKPWRVQTNVYGNGSTSRGREERYLMPFDPTREFHRYSILWTADNIIFYIDDTPIREVRRNEAMGGDYPSKPMALYATIWDASTWATSGGKYRVNYKYGPFVSDFSDLVLLGCRSDPIQQKVSGCDAAATAADLAEYAVMTPERRRAMREFRENYMTYSVCHDSLRYPESLPECDVLESERRRFKETGHLKFGGSHRRHARRRSRVAAATNPGSQADM